MREGGEGRFVFLVVSTCLCLGLLSNPQVPSAADVTEHIGQGRVNWTQGLVTASGIGAPPREVKNPAQARAMTQRAAITVARRNLLEVLKGVRIDSNTTVENFIVSSDLIRTQVSGILRGSQVMQTRYFSDGSIEVTVGVRLAGELVSLLIPPSLFPSTPPLPASTAEAGSISVAAAPSGQERAVSTRIEGAGGAETKRSPEEAKPVDAGEGRKAPPESAGAIASKPLLSSVSVSAPEGKVAGEAKSVPSGPSQSGTELLSPPPTPGQRKQERSPVGSEEAIAKAPPVPASAPIIATGLVVDARGLGVKPALLPRILDEREGEIYSIRQVKREVAVEQGLVGYAKDVSAAQRNVRVTDRPLLVKGIRASGKERTDVVIPDSDASMIRAAVTVSNFLEKSRVIIVYD